ncbi:MAG: rhodanese-like domain-containing protein [Deltaproteobacteria bacterium]|nr:rhodanese-like domain-containing protein [Deltaproteobacteria bacterium]
MTELEVTPQQMAAQLKVTPPPRLLDIREPWEFKVVRLEGAQLATQELVDEVLSTWERDAPIICYCHHGVRSLQATLFLRQQGFTKVYSLRGGINAYAMEVDPQLPRY